MKKINLFFTTTALLAVTIVANAQDKNTDQHSIDIKIPEVAILDLETSGKTAIALEALAPTEAGNPLDFSKAVNSDLWINYSSIIGSKTEPTRDVTVQITSGEIPAGVEVSVEAAKDAGMGKGTVGSPSGSIKLSSGVQTLITEVGSCYTGNGPKAGHNLTYKMNFIDGEYGKLDFDQSQTVIVTYTLSDK